jgi:hypothetical protein
MPPGRTLAELQEAAPEAGERQQHDSAGEIETDPALHTPENASSFFNVSSMPKVPEFVKDKKSLPACDPEKHVLDPIEDGIRFSDQIIAPGKRRYCAALIPRILPMPATVAR